MERWQWRVAEAVYVAAQGEKPEAVARLHRMELLFRKTGHVAAEITATGCRGLVQASIAWNQTAKLAARQVLMRSVYLAQEQKQQAEEVAAAVADKCALKLSLVVVGKEGLLEAVGWFRLQRPRAQTQVEKLLLFDACIKFEGGLCVLLEDYVRSGEEAAAALELDAAMNWYHKAADVARVLPSKQQVDMSHLSYRIGELQYKAGDWMESLQMLSDSLKQVLSKARYMADNSQWNVLTIDVSGAPTPGYVTKACRLVHRVQALLDGRAQVGDGWDLQQDAGVIDEIPFSQVQVVLGEALCALSKPEGIRWLEAEGDGHARELSHSRHYVEAARTFEDLLSLASEDMDDATRTPWPALYHARLLMSSAYNYKRARQYQLAAKMLNHLESMIQTTTSWPPPGPGTGDADPKQSFEYELCSARAGIALQTGRHDELVIWLHKAASLQEAIINDMQQRQLPVAEHLRTLVFVLTHEAYIYNALNEDDVKGLEARIERIQTLDPDAGTVRALQALLLMAKGDREEAVKPMRELFLLIAERQEGNGGDDDSWITDYDLQGAFTCISLWMVVYMLEFTHIDLGRPDKALLWAERGRMRLFMHRVHAQQHQEDDPEWAMDSTPNDFDRDDEKALTMLFKVLLACGPNVALLEYSNFRHPKRLRIYYLFSDLKLVAGFESPSNCKIKFRSIILDYPGIEQLVKKARDSIIARLQQKQEQLRHLAQLHSLLVAPVLKELPDSCDTLIFVPDGCLSQVPFAALYDKSAGQFLVQQKQVVVAPCLRALHRCLNLQARFFSTASTELQQPFVAGNPFPMGLGMPQLQHAQEEAAAVADILGVKPCLRAAVTKEAVVKALTHSSVVVLASHAIVGPKFPSGALVLQGPSLTHDPDMASSSSSRASTSAASNYYPPFLRAIMTDPGSDEPEAPLLMRGLQASVTDKSQVLTADELSGMRIRAGLVVLSACETGRGEVTPEGVLGLGRALLQAGAATTVLSLWKVDDRATKRLITEMFQELQKGEPVGTALRKAMLKMIQEGSSISQWAPFFIFGSPTMHLRNVTTLKGKKKMNSSSPELDLELGQMNGSSPKLELGDGMQQVLRPTSDATSSASSASDQATVQVILVGTHESAWLDSSTGAICRRLFPRGLNITWGDAEQYWTWRTLDSSTNSNEVAVLKQVCWLDLRGRIKGTLTPGTVYTLSWRVRFAVAPFTRGFNEHPVRFFLDTSDGQHHVVDAFLNSSSSRADPRSRVNILWGEDGWHEYEVADFSVPAAAHGQEELEVAFGMWEHSGNWKCGLYVDSVVLRPRQAPSRKDLPLSNKVEDRLVS